MRYLKQFVWLIVAGDSIEARLRARLAKEAVVEPADCWGHFGNGGRERFGHSGLVFQPQLFEWVLEQVEGV